MYFAAKIVHVHRTSPEASVHHEHDAKYAPPPLERAYCEICGAELPAQEHIAILHDGQDSGDNEDRNN